MTKGRGWERREVGAGVGGICCCALLFLSGHLPGRPHRPSALMSNEASLAKGITRELFSNRPQLSNMMARQQALRGRSAIWPDNPDDHDHTWRSQWEGDWIAADGVNVKVDSWFDPNLCEIEAGDSVRQQLCEEFFRNPEYTAGHHPKDEYITNATAQFFADDWKNMTTNETWIDDDDFRWESPADFVGARPLEVDHHRTIDHHHVKFLPGVNINSNPICGQKTDGSPIDCGESEWFV